MFTSVAQANAAVIEQIRRARPHWLDVQPASAGRIRCSRRIRQEYEHQVN
ncbi:hypothetical protein KVQ89_08195 [Escherichia fergusonii]|nr:hypothetical protein [Escherichia fergusonii]